MSARFFRIGNVRLYPADRLLVVNDAPASIGGRAFDLLLMLVERPRQLVTKAELLERVWSGLVVENNNIAAQVMALRKLLGSQLIETVAGHGYRLNADPEPGEAHTGLPARAADAPTAGVLRVGPRLYGRQRDMVVLTDLLQQPGWITLTGPAGVGKTALAQALAFAWTGPAVWLDLAALSQPAQVLPALARELGVTVLESAEADELLHDALIVLDNAEHVRPGVATVADFLRRRAPTSRLLVTSLAPIEGEGERLQVIAPLTIASPTLAGANPEDHDPLYEGAIGLLVARIEAADRRLRIRSQQLPLLREVCLRLDGLPLAIEMAAARVPLLGLQGVHQALGQRFALLQNGHRRPRGRHRSLQTALDWSHDLLAPDDQALFRILGVFSGGFTLQTVVELAAAVNRNGSSGDAAADRWRVIDRLGTLVEHSLVMTDAAEPPRYRLLESVRAYALERLQNTGAEAAIAVHRHHAEQVLRLMHETSRAAASAPTGTWDAMRDRSVAELDNARAAFDWCLRHDASMAIELSIEVACLGVDLAIDLDLLAPDSIWDSESFLWLSACEPLLEQHDVPVPLQAAWWRAFALHLLVRHDARVVEAARNALRLYRPIGDDVGLYWSCTALLRSVGRFGTPLRDELAAVSAEMATVLARNPGWPAAVRIADAATRRLAFDGVHIAGRLTPAPESPSPSSDPGEDRMPELRYYLSIIGADESGRSAGLQ